MILVVDIGNTFVTIGLYKNKKLEGISRFEHKHNMQAFALSKIFSSVYEKINPQDAIISSVADEITNEMIEAINDTYKINPLILTSDLELDINLKVKAPETIGADRLANIYAASILYPDKPLIVIDSGTATTFDILDNNGDFIGGIIMPGLEMQFKALNEHTSKLPFISKESYTKAHKIICTNTKNEIISGTVRGYICSIEGLIKLCEQELNAKLFVVITGGGAELIAEFLPKQYYNEVNLNLTLQGIGMIYERNID